MLEQNTPRRGLGRWVSVAGCLGYDVLGNGNISTRAANAVSVAGCLGYDVLACFDSHGSSQGSWFRRSCRIIIRYTFLHCVSALKRGILKTLF